MLIGIEGFGLGAGKTVTLTYLTALAYAKGYHIYSLHHLNFPYTPVKDLFDVMNMKRYSVFCADELWLAVDARMSQSDKNRFISKIAAQSRKRDFHIFYTQQTHVQIDIRIRRITDYWHYPMIVEYLELNDYYYLLFQSRFIPSRIVVDVINPVRSYRYQFNPIPVLFLFNTKEIVGELSHVEAKAVDLEEKFAEIDRVLERFPTIREASSLTRFRNSLKAFGFSESIIDLYITQHKENLHFQGRRSRRYTIPEQQT